MSELTTDQRLDSLEGRMNDLSFDMRELRRQSPARWAPAVYGIATLVAIYGGGVALDNGKVWEMLLAPWLFVCFALRAVTTWQDLGEWKFMTSRERSNDQG